jgi:hypothetical protein
LVVKSSVDSHAEVYYIENKEIDYKEIFSVAQPLYHGENTIYFFLPADEIKGPLRLDVSRRKGQFLISSIIIKAIKD